MASKVNNENLLYEMIGVVLVLFVIVTFLGKTDFPQKLKEFRENTRSDKVDGKLSFIGSFFPTGNLSVNQKIANKGSVIVRSEPAGQILGRQVVREKGIIVAGPVEKFDKIWWRIDYPKAPDGWVWDGILTNKTVLFSVFNILPITYDLLKPFFVFLSILIFVLIVIVLLKNYDLNRLKQKRIQFENEKNILQSKNDFVSTQKTNDESVQLDQIEISNLPTGNDTPKTENPKNKRWSNIQTLINSHNVNDWRQAIIEADIILEEMLDRMGYKGDSIGEKLKQVEKSDFLTLDSAWEAHKIRNRIAHKGSNYVLSKDDAERAIELYRAVFSEFYYI
ncbi:MAG TPA: hypothetical protein PJ997_02355 [Candidatus Paceibacterota bacterium]|nr:hypothetical protein [Candidatus Paceibacterota bacterium]HMP19154.1 hypothetical protein [Candidatus Paceibacterota bacterium]HMP85205.1 hypothetical protein [Candidatus Paceibacterota bacterium]